MGGGGESRAWNCEASVTGIQNSNHLIPYILELLNSQRRSVADTTRRRVSGRRKRNKLAAIMCQEEVALEQDKQNRKDSRSALFVDSDQCSFCDHLGSWLRYCLMKPGVYTMHGICHVLQSAVLSVLFMSRVVRIPSACSASCSAVGHARLFITFLSQFLCVIVRVPSYFLIFTISITGQRRQTQAKMDDAGKVALQLRLFGRGQEQPDAQPR